MATSTLRASAEDNYRNCPRSQYSYKAKFSDATHGSFFHLMIPLAKLPLTGSAGPLLICNTSCRITFYEPSFIADFLGMMATKFLKILSFAHEHQINEEVISVRGQLGRAAWYYSMPQMCR